MTPLKELYQRVTELQNKLTNNPNEFFTEDQNELSETNTLITLRERYLQRYINHPPFALKTVQAVLEEEFAGLPNTEETRSIISEKLHSILNEWLATRRQVACKFDADDLEVYLAANLKEI